VLAARLRLRTPQLHLQNLAVPGETSHSMLGRGGQLERLEELLEQAAARHENPAPVLISIGGNDVMEAQMLGEEVALALLRSNLDNMFGRLAAALRPWRLPLGQVACIQTIYNPFEGLSGNGHHSPDTMAPRRATRGGFNGVIREAAAAAGVRVAEVARHFRGRAAELTWVRSGDIHPSDAGHQLIADVYANVCGWGVPR
jgi:lysophospholipase L1-like esterase